jgi:hypothetical protein
MEAALRDLIAGLPVELEVLDVDADPELVERYDELVPVLLGDQDNDGEAIELCHYFLDATIVRDHLSPHVTQAGLHKIG